MLVSKLDLLNRVFLIFKPMFLLFNGYLFIYLFILSEMG